MGVNTMPRPTMVLPLDRSTFSRLARVDGREAAMDVFEAMAMPDPAEEDWRYVDLDVDLDDYGLADRAGPADEDPSVTENALGDAMGTARIVDGHVVDIQGDGVRSLDDATVRDGRVPADLDRFAAAHGAFGADGVVVHAGPGVHRERPVYVDVQATTSGVLSLPKVVVVADDGADVSVVVDQRSADGVEALVVPHIEVVAGAAARTNVTVVQAWGADTVAVAQHRMVAGRDATVGLAEAGLGGRFSRLHLTVDLMGSGADARVLGLYFGDEHQTLDYRYFMNHAAPHTTSEMFLKGAVADHAKSVFTGLIRIEPEGQRTNAHQTNRNLVLSDDAEAHSVPNLEILANDVRCGHGSTVGPLDAEQRYYLMSRGLPRSRADRLQVKGFFEDVLARFPHESLRIPLRSSAMAKYERFREAS